MPSTSSEEAFQLLEEAFQFAAQLRRKHTSGKVPKVGVTF